MRKRITSVFLLIIMLFTAVCFKAAAAKNNPVDFEMLGLLGIALNEEGGEYITRAQLAEYAVKLINAEADSEEEQKYFKDTNNRYINTAYRYGLMFGKSDNTFAPDDNCTKLEMCTVLLRAAQYTGYADIQGGYSQGYEKASYDLGLLSGRGDSFVTKDEAMLMLRTALSLETPEVHFKNGAATLVKNSGKTVMERYFNIRQVSGRIVSVDELSIGGYDAAGMGTVSLLTKDGVEIFDASEDFLSLGYRAEAYVKDEGHGREIVFYIKKISDSVNEINLISGDISSVSKDLDEITYAIDDERERRVRLSEKTIFIYNGVLTYGITTEDIDVKNGNVMFVDFNLDEVYDIVHINSYKAYLVGSKNSKNSTITDKITDQIINIDIYSSDYETSIVKNGRACEFGMINELDVVLIGDSKPESGTVKRSVIVQSDVVRGKVERISDETLTVDGTEIEFIKGFDRDAIEYGQMYVFGLNMYGQICLYEKQTNPEQCYAYVYKLYKDDTDEDKIYIKVLNEAGEFTVYRLAQKFYLNGEKSTWDGIYNKMTGMDSFSAQLVLLKFDSDGEVKKIFMAGEIKEPQKNQPEGLFLNMSSENTIYKSNPGSFGAQWIISPETKIFEIYTTADGSVDTNYTRVTDKTKITLADASRPNVKIYNSGMNRIAQAAVITYSQNLSGFRDDQYTRQMIVVNSVEDVVSDDGEIVKVLNGVHLGNTCRYEIYNEAQGFDLLERGDCIYGNFNSRNVLYGYEMRFSLNKKQEHSKLDYLANILFADMQYTQTPIVGNANSTRGGILGVVTDKTAVGNAYVITLKTVGTNEYFVYLTDGSTYIYNSDNTKGKPELSYIDDLDIGSKVFLANRYGMARDILVYRQE